MNEPLGIELKVPARPDGLPKVPALLEGDVGAVRAAEAAARLAIAEEKHRRKIEAGEVETWSRAGLDGSPCSACGQSVAVLSRGRDGAFRCEPCTIAAGFDVSVFEMVRRVSEEAYPD